MKVCPQNVFDSLLNTTQNIYLNIFLSKIFNMENFQALNICLMLITMVTCLLLLTTESHLETSLVVFL